MTADVLPGRPLDAVLCGLDHVIRFYGTSRPAEPERSGARRSAEIVQGLTISRA